MFKGKLINSGLNAKTIKSDKASNYITAIMYLAPADTLEGINVCPMAYTAKCRAACLYSAGRGAMNNVQQARLRKTKEYAADRSRFMATLGADLKRFVAYCERKGAKPAVRLNGTSDIQWERGHKLTRDGRLFNNVFDAFPEIQFYDYSKIAKRVRRRLPSNYALVLSYSEANPIYAMDIMNTAVDNNANVAVVYRSKEQRDAAIGSKVNGLQVIDGDETDLRFTDPQGSIVGLYAKGKSAREDQSGFVVDWPSV